MTKPKCYGWQDASISETFPSPTTCKSCKHHIPCTKATFKKFQPVVKLWQPKGTDEDFYWFVEVETSGGQIQYVEIFPRHYDQYDGHYTQWCVVWEGAVDFTGNKRELLARYPEFRPYLRR